MTHVSFSEACACWTTGTVYEQRLASRTFKETDIAYLVADELGFLCIQSADFNPRTGAGWAAPISIHDTLSIWTLEDL